MAQQRKRQLKDLSGKTVPGTWVGIVESTERFSDVKLEDGTVLRVRTVVQDVVRFDDQWDPSGNPMYSVTSATMPTVLEAPEVLRKPASGRRDN